MKVLPKKVLTKLLRAMPLVLPILGQKPKIITKPKPWEKIKQALEKEQKIYLIGCGGCATLAKTGGKLEVLNMKKELESIGKIITGWMIIPQVCDILTCEYLREKQRDINKTDSLLVLACGAGVQRVVQYLDKPVHPALDSLFFAQGMELGKFEEVCQQCGDCVLEETAGICPFTRCAKGLLNGPCGGAKEKKCEVDREKDCAWLLIYERLKLLNQLEKIKQFQGPKNYSLLLRPRHFQMGKESTQ